MSKLEFSWDQKRFFWVFRWKQLFFAFRIPSNKTNLPVSSSEFQFVFTAVRCSYIFIACVKTVRGWCTGYTSRVLTVRWVILHPEKWFSCLLMTVGGWDVQYLTQYLFLLQTVVLTVLFLVLNVRKHNFISSVKVGYAKIIKICSVFNVWFIHLLWACSA